MTDAPDLIAPIVGYRQWRLARNAAGEAELSSGGIGDAAWIPGTNRAECKLTQLAAAGTYSPPPSVAEGAERPHEAPGAECSCGMYGTHALDEPEDPTLPTGAIVAWGRIEVHRTGLRAEYARVAVLGMPKTIRSDAQRELVAEAAERYGVPCVSGDRVEELARGLGSPVPRSLLPEEPGDLDYQPSPFPGRRQPVDHDGPGRPLASLGWSTRVKAPLGMRTRERTYDPIQDEEELSGEPASQLSIFLSVMGLLGLFALFALIASLL